MTIQGEKSENLSVDKSSGIKPESLCIEEKSTVFDKVAVRKSATYVLEGQNGVVVLEKGNDDQERTKVKKRLFIEVYQKTLGSVSATCEKVKIDRQTFYNWRRDDPDFLDAIRNSWQKKLDDVEEQLNKNILRGDVSSIRYFLDRRHPLYKPKIKVEGARPGDESMEDDFNEAEWVNDKKDYEENNIEQLNGDSIILPDQGQARADGSVQAESGSEILLEQKDEKKPDIESTSKGD